MNAFENKKVEFKLTLFDNDGAVMDPPSGKLVTFDLEAYVESSSKIIPKSSNSTESSAIGEEVKSSWLVMFDHSKIPDGVNLLEGWNLKVPNSDRFYPFLDVLLPSGRYAKKVEIFV
ncbi:hypothetical protein [Leptospira perdikensis]|uniref:Uncharacterized protein n=1 Tax=Leptospira perdikensis TaxID=2484948 RepID=A0A4R9J9R5_9LEPT|nr:hypothetical protein [Leptospira perdikensis]TGL35613.1 hypothetical protein EHQ49_17710 [Leptospira perdikensis]